MQDLQGRSITIEDVHDNTLRGSHDYVIDVGGQHAPQYDLRVDDNHNDNNNNCNSSPHGTYDGLLHELKVTSEQLKCMPVVNKKLMSEPLGFVTNISPGGLLMNGKILHQISYKPPPPDNYLLLSCIVLFCCNPPFGMLAMFYSVKTTKSHEDEQFTLSKNQSRMSRRISLVGVFITFILAVTFIILFWPEKP